MKNNIVKLITNITFITFIIFISVIKTHAASSVSVFPSIISLSLSPGKISSTTLTIKNNGESPIPIRIRFEPLVLSEDSSALPSIGSWISLSKSSLLIPSQQQEKINILISIPKKVELGGYYGMLYIEPLTSVQSTSDSQVMTKMGVLLLGSIGVQGVSHGLVELQKPQLSTLISESQSLTLSYQIKNNSLTHFAAKPFLLIHPLNGKTETIVLEERLVFPGKTRKWISPISVIDGKKIYYSAELFVSLGNGTYQKQPFYFIIFPVRQAIILVLCIATSISIVRKRKQIKKAMEILVRG